MSETHSGGDHTDDNNTENPAGEGTESETGHHGSGGDDHLVAHNGGDDLYGDDGDDTLKGSSGNDTLHGGHGNDTIRGGGGDDTIVEDDDDGGDDTVDGGSGNDTFEAHGDLHNSTFKSVENLKGGDITGSISQFGSFKHIGDTTSGGHLHLRDGGALDLSHKLSAGVEVNASSHGNSIKTGSGDDHIHGGHGNDSLFGGGGGDTENGGSGSDDLHGGSGHDSLSGGNGDDLLNGDSGSDDLSGDKGNDRLDGGKGNDHMYGGVGDDTYVVDSAGDTVKENTDSGIDTVQSGIDYTLGRNVENLTLTGAASLHGTGNSLSNFIIGNDGNNWLDGGKGNDTLTGGAGADTFVFGKHSGLDTITDFSAAGGDTIDLHRVTHGHVHDACVTQSGADVHIDLGGGNVITVVNATAGAAFLSHITW